MAVSDAIKDIIQDKVVCELGCAEGDNLFFMSRYAKKVIGFEYMKSRYEVAKKRGIEVIVGDYYKDDIPDADVYYFWPDDGANDNEYLMHKILQKPNFNGHVIIGGDTGFPPEVPSVERCSGWGELIRVPYDEGRGPRQHGIFLLAVIDASKLKQQAIWLLSPPRSGSSCTAGCFKLAGLSLGKNETDWKDQYNRRGYFENSLLMRFNEKVLRKVSTNISATKELTAAEEQKTVQYSAELASIIKSDFSEKFFLIKDPRINLLNKLYIKTFQDLDIVVKLITLTRPKEQVIKSMDRMLHLSSDIAEKNYVLHHTLMKELKNNFHSYDIDFEKLLKDPNSIVSEACKALGVPYGIGSKKKKQIRIFAERKLLNFK
jgi:hypothetical protein